MSIKSAEEYREEARRVRAVAMKVTSRTVRATLLGVAVHYDELARHVERLAARPPPRKISN
jgi:hypothetical protein